VLATPTFYLKQCRFVVVTIRVKQPSLSSASISSMVKSRWGSFTVELFRETEQLFLTMDVHIISANEVDGSPGFNGRRILNSVKFIPPLEKRMDAVRPNIPCPARRQRFI